MKFHLQRVFLIFSMLMSQLYFVDQAHADLFAFTSHTFTNCSATGASGPTQAACRSGYSTTWDENNSYFTVTSGIQNWVAPATATYQITAAGATGVGGAKAMSVGVIIRARIELSEGSTYKILIGQSGLNGSCGSGGGGGGTFLTTSTNTPLIVAGGGGGSLNGTNPSTATANGQTTTSGSAASDGSGAGGTAGGGGRGSSSGWGSGGAGLTGNGTNSANGSSSGGTAFINGGIGGTSSYLAVGGFGGGGGTHGCTGGGGGAGGYSGGGGSTQGATSMGGGGGSFVVSGATNIATSNGSYNGSSSGITNLNLYNGTFGSSTYSQGYLTIEKLAAPDTTAPTFPSAETFNVAENSTSVGTVVTSESATITIFGGEDQAKFSISRLTDSSTALSFSIAPNFESPIDVGADNTYVIVFRAVDGASNAGYETVTVTVTDVVDTSSFTAFSIAAAPVYRTVVQISANVSVPAKVTFKVNNLRIPGCIGLRTSGTSPNIVATCNWKPSKRGSNVISAVATPTTAGIAPTTSALLLMNVARRTGTR